ncbi:MAG TPA: hypothetical protein VJ783_18535, partial [Pirellulales bacterium]|nr:hypothetical protein [Pirellulales bacterium]
MKSLPATAFRIFALSFVLASNAPAQESTGVKTGEEAVISPPADVLPVAEAKKRYLESQKQLDELAKGGWTSDQIVEQRVMALDVTRVHEPRERLRAAVAAAYDARRQLQQSELAELERRIANIKRALAISDAMKETIIDQRTDELLDQIEEGDKNGKREGASVEHPSATDAAVAPLPGSGAAKASALAIKEAQIEVKDAEAKLTAAQRAHDYSKKMHAKGFVSEHDVESKASGYERAKLELERARLKLQSLDGTLPHDEPVSDKAIHDGATRDAEKKKRLAELDVEEAEADFAAAERDYLRVSAAHESGTATQEAFDKADNKYKHAKIELERARLKLEAFGDLASGDKPLYDGQSTSLVQIADGKDEPQIVWGPAVGFLQLGWDIEPRKDVYHLGEVLTFGLIVRNSGDKAVQVSLPRTNVLEKLGFDLRLLDEDGQGIRHFWGPAHVEKDKLEVSGYLAQTFEPGGTHELAVIKVLVGRGKILGRASHDPSIFAALDVTAGQTARLWFDLT